MLFLLITTYNLHGFNQGRVFLPTLCGMSDVILIQVHELHLIGNMHTDFVAICTSAMAESSENRPRRGRPWGGVGIMVCKSLPSCNTIAKRERFISVLIRDAFIIIVNVYFPLH